MNTFYVYALIDPISNLPFYIGKGTRERCFKHLRETKDNTENYKKWAYIQGIRNKGFEPRIEKLYTHLAEETAYYVEELLIWKYGRRDIDTNGILTNICDSGRPPVSSGSRNPMFGRHHSDESKQRMSAARKGKSYEEYMGVEKAAVRREQVRAQLSGKTPWNKGGNLSAEHIEKVRDSVSKKYKVTSPDGSVYETTRLRDFCSDHGLVYSSMNVVSQGLRKQCRGWKCEKMED